MKRRQEIRLRYFEQLEGQRHISSEDYYLYSPPEASRRLAIIGCGTIGQEHAQVASLLGRALVHGFYDEQERSIAVAQQRLEELTGQRAHEYSSIEAACADHQVDAFIIATPNYTHLEVVQQVMKSGKPILIEKPMVTTLADAETLVKLCSDYQAPVFVGLQYRFKAIYAESSHEVNHRKSVGDVRTLHMYEHRPPFLDKVKQWNKFSSYTGGTLVEKCCHYFDLLNRHAGSEPISVFAQGNQAVNFRDFEYDGSPSDIMDNAVVIINYANGVRANFELNMFSPNFHEELIICGERGRITARETFDVFQTQQSKSTLQIELAESGAARNVDLAYPSFIESSGHHGATYYEHNAFMDALEGKASDVATVHQGYWSIAVAAAAEQSVKSGEAVNIRQMLAEHNLNYMQYEENL